MPIPRATVISQIEQFGGTPIRPFDQAARKESSGFGGNPQLSGGFCQGACLDWIRRVVQHGHPEYNDDPDHVARQTARMAKSHVVVKSDLMTAKALVTDPVAKLLEAYNTALDQRQRLVVLEPSLVQSLRRITTVTQPDTNGAYKLDYVDTLLETLRPVATTPEGLRRQTWKARLDYLDRAEQRPKRPFNGIEVAGAEGPRRYAGVRAALTEFVGMPAFVAGTAMIIQFDIYETSGRLNGHAIALHRVTGPEGRDHLFDPNYGMFDFASRDALRAGEYLFSTVYQQDGARVIEEPGGQCKGQAELFKRAGA